MSRLYVFALTGASLPPWTAAGAELVSVDLDGIHAISERRDEPPAISEETLRRQHDIVSQIAARADAVLPARFGALVSEAELRHLVDLRREVIRRSLILVKGRQQMTVRILASAAAHRGKLPARAASSGTEYLNERRAAASGRALPGVDILQGAVRDVISADRVDPGKGRVVATLYHLIVSGTDPVYRERIEAVVPKLAPMTAMVTGPWAPFAFAPELVG
jgi:hypothetical protein